MGSGVFTGGNIVTCPPLGAEGALMNERRPSPLHALSVNNGVFLAEGALIHEHRSISTNKTPAIKN